MGKIKVLQDEPKKSYKPTVTNYAEALIRFTGRYGPVLDDDHRMFFDYDPEVLKQYLYLLIQFMIRRPVPGYGEEEAIYRSYSMLNGVKEMIGCLTPREFMNLFPVTKQYDGDKWQMKDYYSTMKSMKGYGLDQPIGDKGLELIFDYKNPDIDRLNVVFMMIINRMSALQNEGIDITLDFLNQLANEPKDLKTTLKVIEGGAK